MSPVIASDKAAYTVLHTHNTSSGGMGKEGSYTVECEG